jgi:hypothetical protein
MGTLVFTERPGFRADCAMAMNLAAVAEKPSEVSDSRTRLSARYLALWACRRKNKNRGIRHAQHTPDWLKQ